MDTERKVEFYELRIGANHVEEAEAHAAGVERLGAGVQDAPEHRPQRTHLALGARLRRDRVGGRVCHLSAEPAMLDMEIRGIARREHARLESAHAAQLVDRDKALLVGGHVAIYFSSLPPAVGLLKEGKVRALAVTSAKRSPIFPDLPAVAEAALPGYEAVLHYGIVAPAGTPRPIVDKLSAALRAAVMSEELKERLAQDGLAVAVHYAGNRAKAEDTVYAGRSLEQRDTNKLPRVLEWIAEPRREVTDE